jgi:hypothetical protein
LAFLGHEVGMPEQCELLFRQAPAHL